MDVKFFDSLFEGDSSNGLKLGMSLTNGDFWSRPSGCQNLYCGDCLDTVDFVKILVVTDTDGKLVDLAGIDHEDGQVYFYVLRRANGCGVEEQSLSAVIKVEFDVQGELIEPCCNNILSIIAEQLEGPKIRLIWYYCPVGQQNLCDCFKVYWDNSFGVINFENEVCVINYTKPALYFYETEVLAGHRYTFCVKAVSNTNVLNGLSGEVAIEIRKSIPEDVGQLLVQTF
jgi:hypothetical protein